MLSLLSCRAPSVLFSLILQSLGALAYKLLRSVALAANRNSSQSRKVYIMSKHNQKGAANTPVQATDKAIESTPTAPAMVTLYKGAQSISVPSSAAAALQSDGWGTVAPIRIVCNVVIKPCASFTATKSGQVRIGALDIELVEAFSVNGVTIKPNDLTVSSVITIRDYVNQECTRKRMSKIPHQKSLKLSSGNRHQNNPKSAKLRSISQLTTPKENA